MLELSAFVKAKEFGKNSNLKILPLFFKISPDHLTSVIEDIEHTRPEISGETRIEWKDCLREVRKINGLRFNEGEDEVNFRDEIINAIRTLLPPSPIVSMPGGLVGLAQGQQKVIELLQLASADTPPVALVLYGLGGIGKTTLAEAVLAKIDLRPYRYARVDLNIESLKNDIRKIQKQILKGLFPDMKRKFTSCSEGRIVLTEAFEKDGNKPIFLFIDNALRKQELDELLPKNMKGLPKGSRILVTTRNLGATDMFIEVEAGLRRQEYVVQPLSDQEAKNFLLKDTPDQLHNIEEDVKRILNACKGVPLVLKIVRGHFRKQGYRADKCSKILGALETGEQITQEDLGSTLTDFVYDQLDESSQEAFLDICCFFNGWNPSYVEYIVGAEDLTSLEEAAFVQRSDEKEKLIVHDIIRERGRNKAESTRIVNVKSLIDAANEQRLKDIRGVSLEDECVVQEQHLKAMTKLRVLALEKRMRFSHGCDVTFKELRYLEVGGDIPCLPVNLETFPKLAWYVGPLFKKGFSMYKLPNQLRGVIAAGQSDFNESTYIEDPTFRSSSLKLLDLTTLRNLQKVPQGLRLLTSLEILRWRNWDRMEKLPEEVCQLTKLTKLTQLTLSGWTSLTCLPAGFGLLTALNHLDLSSCRALEGLPESFGELTALNHLDLSSCRALEGLPESFGQLTALNHLDLCSCGALKGLPESFGQLAALEKLVLLRCIGLQRLPESFGELIALKDLDLTYCQSLEGLPESFGQLAALKELMLRGCTRLQRLPESFGQLAALEKLMLRGCTRLQRLPESFGELIALNWLDLSSCEALEGLPESFGELKRLEDLNLHKCKALKRLPESFCKLTALKNLFLSYCRDLEGLPESFGELIALNWLDLCSCEALEGLPQSFGELKRLTYLGLYDCKALKRLPESLCKLKALKTLSSCRDLDGLLESFKIQTITLPPPPPPPFRFPSPSPSPPPPPSSPPSPPPPDNGSDFFDIFVNGWDSRRQKCSLFDL